MKRNREWISISDMMAGLMMVFLFIAVVFMQQVEKDKTAITDIAKTYDISKQSLNRALHKEFDKDLERWGAKILPNNTIRFHEPDVLFAPDSSKIKEKFITILDDFFPRYLGILTRGKYKSEIIELRIEGHTSSRGRIKSSSIEESYIYNSRLSQDRAFSVLNYVFNMQPVKDHRLWLIKVLRANGLSFSEKIVVDGKEDYAKSRRVDFRIITNTEHKIEEILKRAR